MMSSNMCEIAHAAASILFCSIVICDLPVFGFLHQLQPSVLITLLNCNRLENRRVLMKDFKCQRRGREDENCGVEGGFVIFRMSIMQAFNRLQQLDQYPKINEDFYSWTHPGGVIPIVSSILMVLLFSAGKT
ncbi:unnamed protein product [Sphagnum jensenii]|uniref:Uncharacterized protein n=1 Tax=Sphagnum jensenii TaxID=128206 RepID=A0ABP1BX20_9BRYO